MIISNSKRNEIQQEARDTWKSNGSKGLLAMATGTGKSKIAVDEAKEQHTVRKDAFKALLVVPTEKLRDNTWKDEFEKWDGHETWELVRRECYASLARIEDEHYDLIILDEGHYVTPANSVFFKNNTYESLMVLTATPPEDEVKIEILDSIAPIIYNYTLEEAVRDGLVAPFQIIVVEQELDRVSRNIKAGSKAKPFLQTEAAQYKYLNNRVLMLMLENAPSKRITLAEQMRMHFIYNLPSKFALAQKIKTHMKGRYLIFGSNIAQIEALCAPNTFHSKTDSVAYDKFVAEEIDTLGVVKAVNEGQNLPNLDMGMIVQLNAKELHLIQRIGRLVRFRPGHAAIMYIVVAKGTQDEIWVKNALANFDPSVVIFKKEHQL